MASGTIPIPQRIGYVDDTTARTVSIGSHGYSEPIYPPNYFPSGAKILCISAITWSTNVALTFTVSGTNSNYGYVNGPSDTSVSGLKMRFWYIL